MLQGKTLIVMLVILVAGFMGGFVLRPVIIPPANTTIAVSPAPARTAATEARGT